MDFIKNQLRAMLLLFSIAPVCGLSIDCVKTSGTDFSSQLKFYQGLSELNVDFSQHKYIKELDVDIKSNGKLQVKWSDHVIWKIESPSPFEFVFNSSEIKITSKSYAGKERVDTYKIGETISKKDAKGLMQLLLWLRLDADGLVKHYSICRQDDLLRFFPIESEDIVFKQLDMSLCKTGYIKSLKLYEKSGDLINIEFSKPTILRK